jgi:hypothetical protein
MLTTSSDLNRIGLERNPGNTELAARISACEPACRMQACAPEAVQIDSESEATKKLYGLDNPITGPFGRQCLIARRLAERHLHATILQGSPSPARAAACASPTSTAKSSPRSPPELI